METPKELTSLALEMQVAVHALHDRLLCQYTVGHASASQLCTATGLDSVPHRVPSTMTCIAPMDTHRTLRVEYPVFPNPQGASHVVHWDTCRVDTGSRRGDGDHDGMLQATVTV